MEGGHDHHIDIDKISTSTLGVLELSKVHEFSRERCIYRVPKKLRRQNEDAYMPQLISIGPLHHGNEELKAMEEHKRRYLKDFLKLSSQASMNIEEYFEMIKVKETQVRNCYAEIIELSSEEFVKMILVDAAFIIMVLLQSAFDLGGLVNTDSDLIFGKPSMLKEIRWEMMLLENQLPFFVLQDLFDASQIQSNVIEREYDLSNFPAFQEGFTFIRLTFHFFSSWIKDNIFVKNYSSEAEHLLGFLRILQSPSPSDWDPERDRVKTLRLPSVKELHQAGVKFKPGGSKGNNIFDIKFEFEDGILEIPPIILSDASELLFRNLLAYERCHSATYDFADYTVIMHQLVKSAEDAELLVKKGIIENWMSGGDVKVAALFDSLGTNTIVSNAHFPYCTLIEDLNNYYYKTCWPRWKAAMKQDYFTTPWAIVSVIAAAFLFILTFIQTVCSIRQVIN